MKFISIFLLTLLVFSMSASFVVASEDTSSVLSKSEIDGLIQMRQEEKLAMDVYLYLYDEWGSRFFSNIARSEGIHTDSILDLLDQYNLSDPLNSDLPGDYSDEELSNLYFALTEQGSESLESAIRVGLTIEDLDIYDLNLFLANTSNEDIVVVYENLVRGSRNHMRAFTRQLSYFDSSYEAQFLSQEEMDLILSSEQERGTEKHDFDHDSLGSHNAGLDGQHLNYRDNGDHEHVEGHMDHNIGKDFYSEDDNSTSNNSFFKKMSSFFKGFFSW